MKRVMRGLGLLLVLMGGLAMGALSAQAQEGPIYLRGVEPSRGRPGEEMKLILWGGGFSNAQEVQVTIGEIEVLGVWVESDEAVVVRVFIPEDAQPGPRSVEVVATFGPNEVFPAVLEQGFFVEGWEEERPPAGPVSPSSPAPSEEGLSPWVWVGGGVLLWGATALLAGGLGLLLGRRLAVRVRPAWRWEQMARLQWELEATKELPEPKEVCTWACEAKAKTGLLDRWKITALELIPLPLPSGQPLPVRRITDEALLAPLNEAARLRHLGEDEAQVRRRIAPVVDALLEQIMAWGAAGQTPPSIRVDARLARNVEMEFTLYHCEATRKGVDWVKKLRWKGTMRQPSGEYLGVLRGPTAGEPDFAARARAELEGALLKLIRGVQLKLFDIHRHREKTKGS